MEIIAVMAVITALVGLAIPQYLATINRSKETVVVTHLESIHAAMEIYNGRAGRYPQTTPLSLSAINSSLGLNILADAATYTYQCTTPDAGITYRCTAVVNPGAFTLRVTNVPLNNGTPPNPCCSAGTCPTKGGC
jgi:type II secretory pathway pseudopilin PulG